MRENRYSGFPTRSDTNRPVQSQNKVRILEFLVEVEEKLYYPSSENKGADQLTAHLICAFVSAYAKVRVCYQLYRYALSSLCGINRVQCFSL